MINKTQLIILGAGRPHFGRKASAIVDILKNQKTLNFILDITKNYVSSVKFISGFNHNKIQKEFPKIRLLFNKFWKISGPIFSLSKSQINENQDLVIMYSDILVRKNFFHKIVKSESDITVSCDSLYFKRFKNRELEDIKRVEKISFIGKKKLKFYNNKIYSQKSAELMGLIKIKKKHIPILNKYLKLKNKNINKLKLIDLLEFFYKTRLKIHAIDSYGDWAEINNNKDISNFILGSKSETLIRLKNILKQSKILDQVKFSVKSWHENKHKIMKEILGKFENKLLIVRSSSTDEDGISLSNAGKYLSILNVKGKVQLENAIVKVIKSFKKNNPKDEIFIQEHFKSSKYVGVITTKSKESGSPWYVINYKKTNNTEIITKGDSNNVETIFLRRDSNIKILNKTPFIKLLKAIKEIENILIHESLDIEFAITKENQIMIFQIRPLILKSENKKIYSQITRNYQLAEHKYKNYKTNSKIAIKNNLLFGVMPDWNPAEIIGFKPNTLSLSLYEKLITNKVWAKQREEFGYRKIVNSKLLETFAGTPYVSVNKSLESFIPKGLSKKISQKILTKSLDLLKKNPNKHDKIEFEIIPNCLDFDFNKWSKFYLKNSFNKNDVAKIKKNLKIINYNAQKIYLKNLEVLSIYDDFNINKKASATKRINELLKICTENLTLIFSHFARCGFISVIILKSALKNKKITKKKYDDFFNSINTVSKEFQKDTIFYYNRKLSKNDLIKKYGHLRPGTYDITSERYDKNFDSLIKLKSSNKVFTKKDINKENIFDKDFLQELAKIGFKDSKEKIIDFFYGSIEKREFSKFLFTKYLSELLKLISKKLNKYKINNNEISMLTIRNIQDFFKKKKNINDLKNIIKKNTKNYEANNKCDMPNLITSINDFKVFNLFLDEPNFIGNKPINQNTVFINHQEKVKKLDNKVVIIDSADPGYDWIFNYKIKGLITKYGGVNSHMAIRCAELNLTAAIGVGEKIFVDLKSSSKVMINPKNKILKIL